MRVLLVSQYFLPQPLANAEVIGGLAEALAERGHVVDVVTPVAGQSTARIHRYHSLGFFGKDRSSTINRLGEYLLFSLGAVIGGLRTPPPDVILVPSPPPTLGLVGILVGALRRVPVVYNVQDLYPEVAVATGVVQPGAALRLLGRLMSTVYRRAAAVIVIDEQFVPMIRKAAPNSNVVPIRNGVDQRVLREGGRDPEFLAQIGVAPGHRVVMYAGNVGRSQDLDAVARATKSAGAALVIHGGGAGLEGLRAKARDEKWPHVHFSPYRDRSQLGQVFASADLHVVPLRAGIASASVPSKLLSIFSVGRAAVVAAEAGSPAAGVVSEAGGGWVVEPGDENAMRGAIVEALQDADELRRRGDAARRWAEEGASLLRMAREYELVFEAACGRGPR